MGCTLKGLRLCATSHGLQASGIEGDFTAILALLNNNTLAVLADRGHCVVVMRRENEIVIVDPGARSCRPPPTPMLSRSFPALLVSRDEIALGITASEWSTNRMSLNCVVMFTVGFSLTLCAGWLWRIARRRKTARVCSNIRTI